MTHYTQGSVCVLLFLLTHCVYVAATQWHLQKCYKKCVFLQFTTYLMTVISNKSFVYIIKKDKRK